MHLVQSFYHGREVSWLLRKATHSSPSFSTTSSNELKEIEKISMYRVYNGLNTIV